MPIGFSRRMLRYFNSWLAGLDATYRTEPHFTGVRARLLAMFNVLIFIFIPINVVKLLVNQPPGLELRLAINLAVFGCAVLSMVQVRGGRALAASNMLAIGLAIPSNLFIPLFARYLAEPLATARRARLARDQLRSVVPHRP